jgi:hypothetical protein
MKTIEREYLLRNRFTGDVVYAKNLEVIKEIDGVKFIKVSNDEKRNREYLVNKEAFEVLTK